MICLQLDISKDPDPNAPFDQAIRADPLILYHGCSCTSSEFIESQGFVPGLSRFSRDDLVALADIFDSLGWSGLTAGSLAVLKPFSINHDFKEGRPNPIFFAESARRAAGYACIDFAGGEIARTVRICFNELWSYLNDPSVRDQHRLDEANNKKVLKMLGVKCPDQSPEFDPSLLRSKLEALSELRMLAERTKFDHTHGLVYAVKVSREDLRNMEINPSMGVQCFHVLGPENIVAKAIVPNTHNRSFEDSPARYVIARLEQWKAIVNRS